MSTVSSSSSELILEAQRVLVHLQSTRAYRYIDYLDQGGYGVVVHMYDDSKQLPLAIKCSMEPGELELKLWPKFKHKNIMPLIETITFSRCTVFVMPLMRRTLWSHIECNSFYSDLVSFEQCRVWLYDILSGLSYLHRKSLCHQDLKLDNVFLKDDGHACVGDFSLLVRCDEVTQDSPFNELCRPPECSSWYNEIMLLSEDKVDIRGDIVDMWQFGILAVDLLTNAKVSCEKCSDFPLWRFDVLPFVQKLLDNYKYLAYMLKQCFTSKRFTEDELTMCHNFLKQVLSFRVENRLKAKKGLQHPFLNASWPQIVISDDSSIMTLEDDVLSSLSSLYNNENEEEPSTDGHELPEVRDIANLKQTTVKTVQSKTEPSSSLRALLPTSPNISSSDPLMPSDKMYNFTQEHSNSANVDPTPGNRIRQSIENTGEIDTNSEKLNSQGATSSETPMPSDKGKKRLKQVQPECGKIAERDI